MPMIFDGLRIGPSDTVQLPMSGDITNLNEGDALNVDVDNTNGIPGAKGSQRQEAVRQNA
jgi:hypothetical protein